MHVILASLEAGVCSIGVETTDFLMRKMMKIKNLMPSIDVSSIIDVNAMVQRKQFITSTDVNEIMSGKLWKVTAPNGLVNFMAGTYHGRFQTSLSPELLLAIGLSDEIMLEMDSDRNNDRELAEVLFLHPVVAPDQAFILADLEWHLPEVFARVHQTLGNALSYAKFSQHIVAVANSDEIKKPEDILERNFFRGFSVYPLLYFIYLCHICPVSRWDDEPVRSVDDRIHAIAVRQNKIISPLESEMSRFLAFQTLNHHEQLSVIMSEVMNSNVEGVIEKFELFMQAYRYSRNRIFDANNLEDTEFDARDKFLLVTRNEQMIDQALPKLTQGNKLLAVGVAHYAYPYGIISRLWQHGYKVERVYETPNVLHMYKSWWGVAAVAGAASMAHPRLRKAGRLVAFGAAGSASLASADVINSNKPPQESFLQSASRSMAVGFESVKRKLGY